MKFFTDTRDDLEQLSLLKLSPKHHRFRNKLKILFEFELPEICSLRRLVTNNANSPELKLGQEVSRGDLQTLHSNLLDMHRLNPDMEEDVEFKKGLSIKLNRNILKSEILCLISFVWTLETNTSRPQ
jgi:hypothetical protein